MKVTIIVPAYNEARSISGVLDGLLTLDFGGLEKELLLVDDGSTDRTGEIARAKGALVIRHLLNRGVGGALGTGMEAALMRGSDIIVTCDADGQHLSTDLLKVVEPILDGSADVVIGSRMLKAHRMPRFRRFANLLANYITFLVSGVRTTDSQSGLRAYSSSAARRIKIRSNKFEVCSEILGEVFRRHLRLKEVPVEVIYTPYSLSKGQGMKVGFKTLFHLLISRWVR